MLYKLREHENPEYNVVSVDCSMLSAVDIGGWLSIFYQFGSICSGVGFCAANHPSGRVCRLPTALPLASSLPWPDTPEFWSTLHITRYIPHDRVSRLAHFRIRTRMRL